MRARQCKDARPPTRVQNSDKLGPQTVARATVGTDTTAPPPFTTMCAFFRLLHTCTCFAFCSSSHHRHARCNAMQTQTQTQTQKQLVATGGTAHNEILSRAHSEEGGAFSASFGRFRWLCSFVLRPTSAKDLYRNCAASGKRNQESAPIAATNCRERLDRWDTCNLHRKGEKMRGDGRLGTKIPLTAYIPPMTMPSMMISANERSGAVF
jgi:hypothetical protein